MPRTFADHVVPYAQAGWPCILPVPAAAKHPPPNGFTGADGRDTDALTLVEFATSKPAHSIALRMPSGVIGIDVDEYDKVSHDPETGVEKVVHKRGFTTLLAAIERWGPLPATWSSTARGGDTSPGVSRIMFFRAPPRRYAAQLGADVEVIQRHHRYVVVAPSPNPHAGGALYRWYRPDGSPALPDEIPSPAALAELPAAWAIGLSEGATEQGPVSSDHASGHHLLNQLLDDTRIECAEITSVRLTALEELNSAEAGSRHDTLSKRIYQLVQLAASGHSGSSYAIEALRVAWSSATAGEAREREFFDMLTTAARKAVTLVGENQVPRDPCMFAEGFEVPGAAPAAQDGQPIEAITPARWFFPREIIGTHAFDPAANLDQPLAQAVLERTYPLLRYAYDTRGWLLRVPDRWELHGDLTNRAATLVAGLLPIGDPTAEKGSDEEERSKRRARFNTNAGRSAIAKTAAALVEGGMHPCSVRLADLDAEPTLLWAGGLPWDLNACRLDTPMETWLARVDPSTPHLQTAAMLPELTPTPLWDAFLAAVWPDPEIRAWALRVLSVTLTGYADKALPILVGDRDRGKTQVVTLLMSVLGSYAHAADPRLLGAEGAKAHQSIVFALKGRRLSFIDEGPREGKFAAERLKQLTGGGELTANQMNQNPITFKPTHTLVLTTNDEPVLTDAAVRSRVRLIPCEGDPSLVIAARAAIGHTSSPAWRAEAPGVLARMMTEAGAWLANPLTASTDAAPERIRYLAEHLSAEQDPVRTWLEEETEPFEAGTPSRELYGNFVAGCLQANMRRDSIPTENAWGRALTRLGYPAVRDNRSKRRQLRIRQGGLWIEGGAAIGPVGAALVPDSQGNAAPTFSQVNPSVFDFSAASAAFQEGSTHVHAPAHTHEALTPSDNESGTALTATSGLTCENTPFPELADPAPSKPKRQQSEAAKAKAAETRAAKRLAAIEEAAGSTYQLPAVVLRDGTITELSADQAAQLLATLGREPLTVDVEHTGFPVGHRHYALRTVQLGDENFATVLDPHDDAQRAVIRHALAIAPVLHAHSATADLIPLAHADLLEHGIDEAWSRMHDTVIPAKLADPESTGSDPSLKKLAPAVLGEAATSPTADEARKTLFKAGKWLTDTEPTTEPERSGWAQVDPGCATMLRYAACDVLDDAALARRLPPVEPELLERERIAQRMVARVADVGIQLDGAHVDRLRTEQRAKLEDAATRLHTYGVQNAGSDQQVGAVAVQLGARLPLTPTGRVSVAKGALEQYDGIEGPLGGFVRARLDYQKAETALGLFLEPYHQLVANGDGRARPTVYTMQARTGRMSCVRPNIQQLPREGGFRACFNADPGHVFISADFAGVELRVAAALSQDPNLLEILAQDRDLHGEAAAQVFGVDPATGKAPKARRYKVKSGVFGWLYGGRAPTLSGQMGVSTPVAQQLIDTLGNMLPGLVSWTETTKASVQAGHTQFRAYNGRTIHMPVKAPHAAPNYCIQGSARELLIDALLRWRETRWGDAVLFPVHDELVAQVPEADAQEATAALAACMATELYGVPIVAEASEPAFAWQDSA